MMEKINNLVTKIKQEKPLILNLTNYVTMDFVANGLCCLGASPVMSYAEQEMEDLIPMAKAVVLNPGTLDEHFIALCTHACKIANQHHIPLILDPVGAGATSYRTQISLKWLTDFNIAIVRGNASEIMALAGAAGITTKGVDSTTAVSEAISSAKMLAEKKGVTVVISGKTDVIVDDKQIMQFERGSPMMPRVIGTGCLLSAVVGAFHAVEENCFTAAAAATLFYGLCGEKAAEQAAAPGSFRTAFLDVLYSF
ncbi:MAG: hydroxyethylthiazole kinase [Gammaproteobacteria bacterium]|jgi:hydroxyethylthiazole kinase|nr:hydroxyethylthiazole kinase [Gammaproteobacteria bacterium]